MTNEWSTNTFPKVKCSNFIRRFLKAAVRLLVVFQTLPFSFCHDGCVHVCARPQILCESMPLVSTRPLGRWNLKVSQLSVPVFIISTCRNQAVLKRCCEIFAQVERIRARQRDFEERCWEPQRIKVFEASKAGHLRWECCAASKGWAANEAAQQYDEMKVARKAGC